MSKKAILLVKDPKNSHSGFTIDEQINRLGTFVDGCYGQTLDKEVYKLNKGTYTLGKNRMEDIINKFGTDIIVVTEWVARVINRVEDFDYFYNLVEKDGVEFCFYYDRFIWKQETNGRDIIKHIAGIEQDSLEKSDLAKQYSKPRQKKEPADESPVSES